MTGEGDIFFLSPVKKSEAEKLASHLEKLRFNPAHRFTIQLARIEKTTQVRVVIVEGSERDPQLLNDFRDLGRDLSVNVFNNNPVEIHLCNPMLVTQKVIRAP